MSNTFRVCSGRDIPLYVSYMYPVYDRVLESTADASDCRIHGATVSVAVRDVDVYHHRLDSASCAPRLLRRLLQTLSHDC